MEQPTTQPTDTPQPQPSPMVRTGSPLKNILMGILIGVLVGIAGILFYQGHLQQITQALYTATWVLFGFVILTFLIFWGLREYLTRFVFGSKTAGAGDVLEDAQRVSDVITERVADKLLADLPIEERGRIKYILPRLANWFIWGRLRNWWWQWILGIFVSLGGLTGTMLLMNQNELLNNQNTLIQRQMSLEEASRRSALVVLMSNIMDKVDREIEAQQVGLSKEARDSSRYTISQSLIGQIAALSHSFKPYRYMVGDTLVPQPLSPERAQLLMTITLLPLDSATVYEVYSKANFNQSDLRGAKLSNLNLERVDLSGSDLSNAELDFSNLTHSILMKVDLTNANLYGAKLNYAYFSGSNLSHADLTEADLSDAGFRDSDLSFAGLREANLNSAAFDRSNLSNADFTRAKLNFASIIKTRLYETDLTEADLKGAKMTSIKQCSKVKSLFRCLGLQDSIKTELQKTHPHLFNQRLSPGALERLEKMLNESEKEERDRYE